MDKTHNDGRGQMRKRDSYEAPLCLNPVCKAKGKTHFISNCDISDKNTKTTLLEEHRRTKKARLGNVENGDLKFARVVLTSSNTHSSTLKALFGEGALGTNLMADQGADANFISFRQFRKIQQSNQSLLKKHFNQLRLRRV